MNHPPNPHLYRWYHHSQSWVVYGIVLLRLMYSLLLFWLLPKKSDPAIHPPTPKREDSALGVSGLVSPRLEEAQGKRPGDGDGHGDFAISFNEFVYFNGTWTSKKMTFMGFSNGNMGLF